MMYIFEVDARKAMIMNSEIVISMLPARFHIEIAKDCLEYGKNLVTASYVSKELMTLNKEVVAKGLVFMNEIVVCIIKS